MPTPETDTELLISHKNELVKQYIEYDGSDRVSKVYTAHIKVKDGEACMVTEYVYVGTSTRIEKRRESYGTWVAATMEI